MQQLRMSRKGEDKLGLLMLCQLPSPSQVPLETSPSHPALLGLGLPSALSPTAAVDSPDPRAQPAFPAQNLHR